ncbi:hypothetical protein O7627_24500 [Solwaraspora sp. WMMD1047]|uniref:hypothetical protein n=1 Tax=Solwaraspora sp. WMMD1047 TaxID=3016102 RepID=UPI0024166B70|nr:hypothetical protein [Solwaraspora sp. WMMD1047]MDG4832445.1 hypothetical protein [Solwaraspora sp. WMMD1047]
MDHPWPGRRPRTLAELRAAAEQHRAELDDASAREWLDRALLRPEMEAARADTMRRLRAWATRTTSQIRALTDQEQQ